MNLPEDAFANVCLSFIFRVHGLGPVTRVLNGGYSNYDRVLCIRSRVSSWSMYKLFTQRTCMYTFFFH